MPLQDCTCLLALDFIYFVLYSSFDPPSTLNPKSTIAFPVKNYYCKAPFLNPKPYIHIP